MALQQRSRRQTSIIARIRPGVPCNIGPYLTTIIISETLRQYQNFISISFSSSNFVVGFKSPDIQLAALYSRTIEAPNLILDMMPWCPEHANYDLPWIIQRASTDIPLGPPKQPKVYITNLLSHGLPINRYLHALIGRQQSIATTSDLIREPQKIYIDGLTGMGKMATMPDFSYLMILELKDFYRAKFRTFRRCAQSCKEICDCAHQLPNDIDPMLKSIDTHTHSIQNAFTEELQFLIGSFGGNVHSEGLYIAEELFGIGCNIYPLYENMTSEIDLTSFKKKFHTSPEDVSATYASRLKIILNAVVQKLHGSPTITSEMTETNNFITYISSKNCSHHYKSSPMITKAEAEADAIYQFLRHKTNVLGYNIVDLNYPILADLVSEINKYNEEINELLLYATRAATMIQQVHTDITKMYQNLTQHIQGHEIAELNILVHKLLTCTQDYYMAAEHGLNTFKQDKETYESILLETKYKSTPAH